MHCTLQREKHTDTYKHVNKLCIDAGLVYDVESIYRIAAGLVHI